MSSSKKEKNRRILVVDDENDVRDFLKIFLESLGWEVVPVSSAAEAFTELGKCPFFLVLTDIAMPDMDGYEFLCEIKTREISSQFALMTGFGYNPNHTLIKINKSLRYPYLFKPFDRTKVAETVNAAYKAYHIDLEPLTE